MTLVPHLRFSARVFFKKIFFFPFLCFLLCQYVPLVINLSTSKYVYGMGMDSFLRLIEQLLLNTVSSSGGTTQMHPVVGLLNWLISDHLFSCFSSYCACESDSPRNSCQCQRPGLFFRHQAERKCVSLVDSWIHYGKPLMYVQSVHTRSQEYFTLLL